MDFGSKFGRKSVNLAQKFGRKNVFLLVFAGKSVTLR